MKKINLLAAMLMLATIGFSQEGVKFGVHAGINVSRLTASVSGQGSSSSPSKVGFNGGVHAEIPVATNFAIQPELSFSQMGGGLGSGEIDINNQTVNVTNAKLKLDYLTLPILFKYKVPNSGLGIYVGPQYGYLLTAKTSVEVNTGQGNGSGSSSVKDAFKSSDFSGIFGLEYYLRQGFGLSARYQLGFVNVAKGADNGESLKNNGFTFTVGYRF